MIYNSLYFITCDTEIVESEEVTQGVILDYDDKGIDVAVDIQEKYPMGDFSVFEMEIPTVVED